MKSDWFGDTYRFLESDTSPASKATLQKTLDHRIDEAGILWIHRPQNQIYLPCISESKVLSVLIEVHDNEGHWAKTGTLAKLRGLAYWPQQTTDVERYIAGCIECARHGPATRSQSLHPIFV